MATGNKRQGETAAMNQPWELTLADASEMIGKRALSPVELTRSVLDRIAAVEPRVLAWARTLPQPAMAKAVRLDWLLRQGTYLGPLHGIPVGIKDTYYTAGVETAAGSRVLAGFVPTFDASVVRRLQEAGAILLGKTATTEFAYADPAVTRNPWNPGHTPGGSSSGSAAGVAAGMCLGAFGTQTGGSIVRPSAFCGVVGFKPTYGRVSRHGIIPFAWSLDHPGPIAKTVRDVALLLSAVAGPDPHDPSATTQPVPSYAEGLEAPLHGLTAGIPDRYFPERSSPAVATAFQGAVRVLEKLGVRIQEVTLPDCFEAGVDAGRVIMHAEGAAFHRDWYKTRSEDYGRKLAGLIEAGLLIPAASYLRAQRVRSVAIAAMRRLLTDVDVLITPSTPGPAPEGLASTGDSVFNSPASTFGLPALGLPMGFGPSGLPLGLQIMGGPFEECTVLRVGAAYEAATPWHEQRPTP
jgi:aspartyl-tRNA(Asn)/glutamyl-tRNA(Gln) amidotransferase subunit A